MHVANHEIVPAARLLLAAAIRWVHPVLFIELPDLAFPGRFFDFRSGHAVVHAEIMVVPNGIDRGGGNEAPPFRAALSTSIAVVLGQAMFWLINVNVVTEHEEGVRFEARDVVPHAFPLRNVAGPATEAHGERLWLCLGGKGPEAGRLGFGRGTVNLNPVIVSGIWRQAINADHGGESGGGGCCCRSSALADDDGDLGRIAGAHPEGGRAFCDRSHHGAVHKLDGFHTLELGELGK